MEVNRDDAQLSSVHATTSKSSRQKRVSATTRDSKHIHIAFERIHLARSTSAS